MGTKERETEMEKKGLFFLSDCYQKDFSSEECHRRPPSAVAVRQLREQETADYEENVEGTSCRC